jgi:hypothetical protein
MNFSEDEFDEDGLASLRVLRTSRASDIRVFREIVTASQVDELILKAA